MGRNFVIVIIKDCVNIQKFTSSPKICNIYIDAINTLQDIVTAPLLNK